MCTSCRVRASHFSLDRDATLVGDSVIEGGPASSPMTAQRHHASWGLVSSWLRLERAQAGDRGGGDSAGSRESRWYIGYWCRTRGRRLGWSTVPRKVPCSHVWTIRVFPKVLSVGVRTMAAWKKVRSWCSERYVGYSSRIKISSADEQIRRTANKLKGNRRSKTLVL